MKDKIQASMMDHLKSKGFPNMTGDQILAECPSMWRKLEEEKLIVSGMSYRAFFAHAQQKKTEHDIPEGLEGWIRGFTRNF